MEKIGLEAVMEMTGFSQGINKYNEMIGKSSSDTEQKAGIMSRALEGIGTAMKVGAAGAAAGITALAGLFTVATNAAMDWGLTLNDVSNSLGTTTEESAGLAVAAKMIGGDVNQLTGQIAFMARGLVDATGKIGPTGKALQELGVNFKDANGNILPTTDILQQAADKINAMPPGLEKTTMMMAVFGKSGKDMSDMLEVLAGTGMQDMIDKAGDMGLAMSGDAANGAETFSRSMNLLKMQLQGFLVQVGVKVLPIFQGLISVFSDIAAVGIPLLVSALQPVIDAFSQGGAVITTFIGDLQYGVSPIEAISNALESLFGNDVAGRFREIAGAVQDFAGQAAAFLLPILQQVGEFITTSVIPAVGELVNWFGSLLPVAIGIVTDIVNNTLIPIFNAAVGFFNAQILPTLQTLWTTIQNDILPALSGLVKWLGTAIPSAANALYQIFVNVTLPILSAIFTFVRDNLIPILSDLVVWLATNIPPAIDAVAGWVTGTLIPALKDAWTFIQQYVIPILSDIVDWLARNIPPAINTAADFITNTLIPVLSDIWSFVRDTLLPTLGDIVTWLATTIGTAVRIAQTIITTILIPAFTNISDFVVNTLLPGLNSFIKWLETDIVGPVGAAVTTIGTTLWNAFEAVRKLVGETIPGALSSFTDWLSNKLSGPVDVAKGIIGGLTSVWEGLKGVIQWIIENAEKALKLLGLASAASSAAGSPGGNASGEHGSGSAGGGTGDTKPQTFGAGSMGGLGAATQQVYNSKSVVINMDVSLNNGWDMEALRVFILDTVRGAL